MSRTAVDVIACGLPLSPFHGSLSPNTPRVLRYRRGRRLAEASLLHALNLFGVGGLRDGKVRARCVGRWCNENVVLAERLLGASSASDGATGAIEPAPPA